jgi:hypothetical protein
MLTIIANWKTQDGERRQHVFNSVSQDLSQEGQFITQSFEKIHLPVIYGKRFPDLGRKLSGGVTVVPISEILRLWRTLHVCSKTSCKKSELLSSSSMRSTESLLLILGLALSLN